MTTQDNLDAGRSITRYHERLDSSSWVATLASRDIGEAAGSTLTTHPIQVCRRDYGDLQRLARGEARFNHSVARLILDKLERAVVCEPEEIGERVVRLNSQIRYRLNDDGRLEVRYLVYPDHVQITGQWLSILSPLGAALIGSSEGESVSFRNLSGTLCRVAIVDVANHPRT